MERDETPAKDQDRVQVEADGQLVRLDEKKMPYREHIDSKKDSSEIEAGGQGFIEENEASVASKSVLGKRQFRAVK